MTRSPATEARSRALDLLDAAKTAVRDNDVTTACAKLDEAFRLLGFKPEGARSEP